MAYCVIWPVLVYSTGEGGREGEKREGREGEKDGKDLVPVMLLGVTLSQICVACNCSHCT